MERWSVVHGIQSWDFDNLKEAEKKARLYEGARIVENWGNFKFVRFYMKGHRLIKI